MRSGPTKVLFTMSRLRVKEVGFVDFELLIMIINFLGKAGW